MIKIARDAAERLLLVCQYMKSREYGCYSMLEEMYGHKQTFKTSVVMKNLYNEGLRPEQGFVNWGDFTQHLVEQLTGGTSTVHHPTLIDIIVDLLQGPYARNVLGGKNLQQLRRAVLLPEEMIKFGESVRKERCCAGCAKALVNGEMTSFRVDGDESAFYCTRCIIPNYAACKAGIGCDGVATIDGKLLGKITSKGDCGNHGIAKDRKVETEPVRDHDLGAGLIMEVGGGPVPPDHLPDGGGWAFVGRDQPPAAAQPMGGNGVFENPFNLGAGQAHVNQARDPDPARRRPMFRPLGDQPGRAGGGR